MLILTEHNSPLETDGIADSTGVHFCVLDFSKQKNPDYYFEPMIYVETFATHITVLSVGPFQVTLPFSWCILVGELGKPVEYVSIEDILSRDLSAFCINPISGFSPIYLPIRLEEPRRNVSLSMPPVKQHQLLVLPIGYERNSEGERKEGPLCIMASDRKAKIIDSMDASLLW
jgi:hypothetical protein